MCAHTRRVLLSATLLVLVIGGASGIGAAQTVSTTDASGGLVEVSPEREASLIEEAKTAASTIGLGDEVPSQAGVLYAGGTEYVVLSSAEIRTGEADVTGQSFTGPAQTNFLLADSVTVDTRGDRVDLESLRDSPSAYHGELVRVELDYAQAAIAAEAGDGIVNKQFALGGRSRDFEVLPPADSGAWAANLSTMDSDVDVEKLRSRVGADGSRVQFVDPAGRSYWLQDRTIVDAVVVRQDGATTAYIANRSYSATSYDTPEAVRSSGNSGEIVQFEATYAHSRVSTSETLETALPCAPDSFNIGVGCVPSVTDAVIHAGYAVGVDGEPSNRMPVVAISNARQSSPVQPAALNVEITGRVVDGGQVLESLEGQSVVMAYEVRKRSSPTDAVSARVDDLRGQLAEELQGAIEQSATADSASGPPEGAIKPSESDDIHLMAAISIKQVEKQRGGTLNKTVLVHNEGTQEKNVLFELAQLKSNETISRDVKEVPPGENFLDLTFTLNDPQPDAVQIYEINGQMTAEVTYVDDSGEPIIWDLEIAEIHDVPTQVDDSEEANVSVSVRNDGLAGFDGRVLLEWNNQTIGGWDVQLSARGKIRLNSTVDGFLQTGSHELILTTGYELNESLGTMTVAEGEYERWDDNYTEPSENSNSTPGFGSLAALLAVLGSGAAMRRRS